MDKSKLNFIIEAIMFLLLMAMAGIGLLMKYVLIPGRERWVKYGRNVELYFFGLDRHEWGTIHLYLGFILLGVLTFHIILHWHMVVGLFRRTLATPRTRTIVLWIFLFTSLILIYFPFLITPEVEDIGRGRGRGRGCQHSSLEVREPLSGAPASASTRCTAGPSRSSCPAAAAFSPR